MRAAHHAQNPHAHNLEDHNRDPHEPAAHKPTARRLAAVCAGTFALVLAMAGTAAAHVTVNPAEAESGGYAKLSFRVPNESEEGADTVEVRVSFPSDPALTSARVRPHPGWTATVDQTEEGVQEITWRADEGAGIGPDEFDEFEISVGPLPDADRLAFPAVQTYDDGEVVAWDQVVEPGQDEPERPAPVLTLTEGGDDGHGHETDESAGGDQQSTSAEGEAPAAGSESSTGNGSGTTAASAEDGTARALGAAGLVVGVLGLLAGVFGLLTARRRGGAGSSS